MKTLDSRDTPLVLGFSPLIVASYVDILTERLFSYKLGLMNKQTIDDTDTIYCVVAGI